MNGAEAEKNRAAQNGNGAKHDLGNVSSGCALQFVKEQQSPEQADERVGVPKGKGDRESDVANCENREGVGNGPDRTGQYGPHDEVLVFREIAEDVFRALQ